MKLSLKNKKIVKTIKSLIRKKEQLEKATLRQQKLLANKISKAIRAAKNEEQQQLCWYLYWYFDDSISTSPMADALGIRTSEVRLFVGPVSITLHCAGCKLEFDVQLDSRTEHKQFLKVGRRYDKWNFCAACLEKKVVAIETANQAQQSDAFDLRTMPYDEYLQTEHWQSLRLRKLREAGYRCSLCNSQTKLHVHHRTYERRGEEWLSDLIALCETCHGKFHDKLPEVEG